MMIRIIVKMCHFRPENWQNNDFATKYRRIGLQIVANVQCGLQLYMQQLVAKSEIQYWANVPDSSR